MTNSVCWPRLFNETLARLERSFEQLKRFTSDASHELRTPLTAIRSVGEIGLQQDGDRDHYREVIGSMLEETERLSRLVESLLTISRADSGQIQLEQSTIALLPAGSGSLVSSRRARRGKRTDVVA